MSNSATLNDTTVETPGAPPQSAPEKSTAPAPAPGSTHTKPKKLPPFAVVVLNDNDHTFSYTIEVLQRVCRLEEEQAWLLANEITAAGRAIVWSGSKEVAELKRDQIKGFGPDFYASKIVRYPLGVVLEAMPE